jgi:hypothetical protein
MNIIELVKDILQQFPKISEVCNDIHIDFTDDTPTNYCLSSTGDSLVSSDILGGQTRQHNFILYAVYQSMNDFDRMSNSGVLLELQMWLESYADKHRDTTFTTITEDEERTGVLEKLTCANGMIYAIPNENTNDTVQYQLQIAAQYQI